MAKKNIWTSEKIRAKKIKKKPVNPFEYKITKDKHGTLNTKIRKHQISRPGQSRVRNRQIQDETIGVEWKKRNKKNVFIDGRIDKKQIKEEDFEKIAVEKFAIEARKKASKRIFDSGIHDIGDDEEEVLTHRGKSLADLERFEDPNVSDDENDPTPGHLSSEQTRALFGGGLMKKKLDHKEIMLDVIAKAKKYKFERQREKEQMMNEFEKFDEEYKLIRNITKDKERTAEEKYADRKQNMADDFSRLMREMRFDARAQPGKKLKSQTELNEEREKNREENLSAMKKRMEGDVEKDEEHIESVENIPEPKEEVIPAAPLAYDMNTGVLLNNKEELSEALRNIRKCDSDGEDAEDNMDEEESDEDSEGSESGEILNPQPDFEGEEAEDDSDISEKANPLSIVDEENEDEINEPVRKASKLEPILTRVAEQSDSILSSYKSFRDSLMKLKIEDRIVLVNSLCQKIVVGTDKDRQIKLRMLFQFSLFCFMRNDIYDHGGKSIAATLYTICGKCPSVADLMIEVLKDFGDKQITVEFVRLFNIIISLYSVSDYNHVLGLSAQIMAARMISKIRARNIHDISLGLYLSSLLLKSVALSGRYIPELFVFLLSVISLAFEEDDRPRKIFPSFKISKLKLDFSQEEKLSIDSPTPNGIIYTSVCLIRECAIKKFNFAASAEIFADFEIINELDIEEKLKSEILVDLKNAHSGERTTLSRKKKVKMLKLYDPKIEEPGRKKESRKQRELKHLAKDVKNARRGALRKLRRDTDYIAEIKLKEQEKLDEKRRAATKRIMGQLSNQEGECKKITRGKYNLFPNL